MTITKIRRLQPSTKLADAIKATRRDIRGSS